MHMVLPCLRSCPLTRTKRYIKKSNTIEQSQIVYLMSVPLSKIQKCHLKHPTWYIVNSYLKVSFFKTEKG